jgi:hypothetical protein
MLMGSRAAASFRSYRKTFVWRHPVCIFLTRDKPRAHLRFESCLPSFRTECEPPSWTFGVRLMPVETTKALLAVERVAIPVDLHAQLKAMQAIG